MDLKIEAGLCFRNFHLGLFLISSMSLLVLEGYKQNVTIMLQTDCKIVANRQIPG